MAGESLSKAAGLQAAEEFDIGRYLAEERAKDLLRFSTAGSVDDGKSTLIGRLLYDTQSVYEDQVRSIEGKGTTAPGVLDLALLTDGLRAEREQGITIDVAYRYFSTPRRKFIIADTPGHEQYTRNMATGASTADAAIVLVDARKGVLAQTRRHAYITALLGVPQLILAVNKMDLVGFSEEVFDQVCGAFSDFFEGLEIPGAKTVKLHFIPVSALTGDNVVRAADMMPWYSGPTLLGLLEALPLAVNDVSAPFRLAVQRVARPHLDFRGFAGQIASGTLRPGDRVQVLPSGRNSRVKRIVTFDGDLPEASAPLSVTLTLEDEIDVSRGDLLVSPESPSVLATALKASLVWMDAQPLDAARRYLMKQMSRTVQAKVREVRAVHFAEGLPSRKEDTRETLELNGIGEVVIESLQPIAVDEYQANRRSGSFVLIDPQTNATVAAGMIREVAIESPRLSENSGSTQSYAGPIAPSRRVERFGHRGAHVVVSGTEEFVEAQELALFDRGAFAVVWDEADSRGIDRLMERGVLVLTVAERSQQNEVRIAGTELRSQRSTDVFEAVAAALELLRSAGIFLSGDSL
jgi:sulfate adenylyltransferase subunit 1